MFRYFYRLTLSFIAMIGCTTQAMSMPQSITFNHDSFHVTLLYLCMAIMSIIFVVLLYALIKQRKLDKTHFHPKFISELIWNTIPFIIVVILAFPAILELIQR